MASAVGGADNYALQGAVLICVCVAYPDISIVHAAAAVTSRSTSSAALLEPRIEMVVDTPTAVVISQQEHLCLRGVSP